MHYDIKKYVSYLHKDTLTFYINKLKNLKKDEIIEIWYSLYYYSNFPSPINYIDPESVNNYEQEVEYECYFILASRKNSWKYLAELDPCENCEIYKKYGYTPDQADKENFHLFDKESLISFPTSYLIELIQDRIKNEDVLDLVPREIESQYKILDEYKVIPKVLTFNESD